jgi:arsenite methyltransferase
MTTAQAHPIERKGRYGLDAPSTMIGFGIGIAATAVGGVLTLLGGGGIDAFWPFLICGLLLVFTALYVHASKRGKFRVWARLLDELELTGAEKVLDLGCGRGAVLFQLAQRLTTGKATGIDLWRTRDQSGNGEAAAIANAKAEGVVDRVELRTGDITDLPFGKARFDLVVSSLAIHNIHSAEARAKAISEAVRVLRPGGRLVIADIAHVKAYRDEAVARGAEAPEIRGLGWQVWWGGPWVSTHVLTATKPT